MGKYRPSKDGLSMAATILTVIVTLTNTQLTNAVKQSAYKPNIGCEEIRHQEYISISTGQKTEYTIPISRYFNLLRDIQKLFTRESSTDPENKVGYLTFNKEITCEAEGCEGVHISEWEIFKDTIKTDTFTTRDTVSKKGCIISRIF